DSVARKLHDRPGFRHRRRTRILDSAQTAARPRRPWIEMDRHVAGMILVICGFASAAGAQTRLITFRSATGSPYGYDAAAGADYNGDGWPDIALPIQVTWGSGVTFSGRNGAALFPLGSPAGFGSTAAWTKTSVGNAG